MDLTSIHATHTHQTSVTLDWSGGAKRRTYFNSFSLDRKSEPGFVVAKFAFVSCGECVDCTTVIMPNALVENARQNFMDYVKKVGPDTPVSDIRIPEIPRFERGVVELADIINVARTGDVAEIAIHTYSIKHRIDVAQCEEQDMKADLVAMLRSNISIQIKWIMSLYDQD